MAGSSNIFLPPYLKQSEGLFLKTNLNQMVDNVQPCPLFGNLAIAAAGLGGTAVFRCVPARVAGPDPAAPSQAGGQPVEAEAGGRPGSGARLQVN